MAIEWLLVKSKAVKSGKEHHKVRNMFINNCIFFPHQINISFHYDILIIVKVEIRYFFNSKHQFPNPSNYTSPLNQGFNVKMDMQINKKRKKMSIKFC